MKKKKDSKTVRKWLKHEYAPMAMALAAILLVMVLVYLFFAGGEPGADAGETVMAYSEKIEITSSGPSGAGRIRMSFHIHTEEDYVEDIDAKEHVVRDLTIEKLLETPKEALNTSEGMETFTNELQKLIHQKTGIPVEGIYFQEFIIN